MTYKALGRSIANYAVDVWGTNAGESIIGKIQRAQNEASSIEHLHSETAMLQVDEHLNILSAQ